ncbi:MULTISPECIES: hypothetical protein [Bacillus cereus group]|uniref:hypothetical protein n=1 Tax=Bacillus cereus group TaxID=86661 RepID=UPI001483929D|nr:MULTISPECIES: hypothetical protein [Bacillus cereus group]
MSEIKLYEFKCQDDECGKIILLERKEDPNLCPYCGGDIDYAPGRIESVVTYTPRSERN